MLAQLAQVPHKLTSFVSISGVNLALPPLSRQHNHVEKATVFSLPLVLPISKSVYQGKGPPREWPIGNTDFDR